MSKKDAKDTEAFTDYIYGNHDAIVGHVLYLPAKNKKFSLSDISLIIHELTHIFDEMFNPKIIARSASLNQRFGKRKDFKTISLQYERLFHSLYPLNYENCSTESEKRMLLEHLGAKIKHFLRGKSAEEKIDIIQELKNHLAMELRAYSAENKFIDKVYEGYPQKDDLKTDVSRYLFREKIDMLNEYGFNIIKKARAKFHKRLKKQQKVNSSEH